MGAILGIFGGDEDDGDEPAPPRHVTDGLGLEEEMPVWLMARHERDIAIAREREIARERQRERDVQGSSDRDNFNNAMIESLELHREGQRIRAAAQAAEAAARAAEAGANQELRPGHRTWTFAGHR